MDPIVLAARSQLEALDAKRNTLLKIIELAESLEKITEPVPTAVKRGQYAARKVRQPTPVTVRTREAVRALLEERGAPVRLRELLSEMSRRGIPVGGKNEVATLAARLSNADEFRSVPDMGWWFTEKPIPEERSIFEEAESASPKERLSASKSNQGDSDGTALVD